jgi:hypothetical protein
MLSARRMSKFPSGADAPMAGRGGLACRIRVHCHPVLGPRAVLRARVDFVHQLRQRGNQVAALGCPRGSALILNSCVAAGSLELGISCSSLSILQAQLGLGRAARTRPSARQDYATWDTGSGHPACRSSGQASCSPGARKALRYRDCWPPDRWAGPGRLVQPGDRGARPFRCPG